MIEGNDNCGKNGKEGHLRQGRFTTMTSSRRNMEMRLIWITTNYRYFLLQIKKIVTNLRVKPGQINGYLIRIGSSLISETSCMIDLMKRPNFNIFDIKKAFKELANYTNEAIEQVDIGIKYHMYIRREQELAKKLESLNNHKINKDFNYKKLKSLSTEALEKLSKIRPDTIGHASRISGVSRSDIAILAMCVS